MRKSENGKNCLLFVYNFTPVERKEFRVGVPYPGKYERILCSDDLEFGGRGILTQKTFTAAKKKWDSRDYSIGFTLPGLSAVVFRFQMSSL